MEVLQVQPRDSYLHYIYVPKKGTAIHWSFTTKRNNIHFGIFKRPSQEPPSPKLLSQPFRSDSLLTDESSIHSVRSSLGPPKTKSVASINLQNQGLIEIIPIQQTLSSQIKVEDSLLVTEPGNYVLVFDNTFSRNTPKLLTLSVTLSETTPTTTSTGSGSALAPIGFLPSQQQHPPYELTGWLLKKKRKKMQGWAKRWFQLSSTGVLSYALSPTSVARGVIQIRQATLTSQPKTLTLLIDSAGMTTTYHLKALSVEDHELWTRHLKHHRTQALAEEIKGCEDWIQQRQVDHAGAVAKESARIEVARGLQVSQLVKEKLQSLNRWLHHHHHSHENDNAPEWMISWLQLKDEFEELLERQDQQWQKMQHTVWQADPFGGRHRRTNNDDDHDGQHISLATTAVTRAPSRLCRFADRISSTFSEKFYDATDITLELSDTDEEDQDSAYTDEEVATTTDDEDDENEEQDWTLLEPPLRRHQLPSPAVGDVKSALAVFRKNVGKDLSSISMPVSMNEPIGMLQRACEELEYSNLLDQAAAQPGSMDRLIYVATFAITSYTSTQYRTGRKPFNPIMTETYESIRPDKGFRFMSEKVCHNPLTIAAHAESKNYKYWQCTKVKSKFWGKSMEFTTEGVYHVTLTGHDDHYTYSKPSSWMRNMIAGEKYLEHAGEMKVTNQSTGEYAMITFEEGSGGGLFGAPTKRNDIVAEFHPGGDTPRRVVGKWSDHLAEEKGDIMTTLWTADPPGVEDYESHYGFTRFCVEMNEITALEQDRLPITDTRYRPDQRLYELGDAKEADKEKKRIEQKQRNRRQELEDQNLTWNPRWFTLETDPYTEPGFAVPDSNARQAWVFNDQYWDTRESGQWPQDTFSLW